VTSRCALLLGGFVAACAGAGHGPDFPTSASFPAAPRHPPSFAPDTAFDVPAEQQQSESAGIVRAVEPLDSEAARDVVSRFFIAVLLESNHDLLPLFAAQAWAISEGSRQPAQTLWRARLAQLDYTTLSGRLVGGPQTLRTYTFQTARRARRDGVPVPATPAEVVVVATPGLSWTGKTRLFGDRLAFRLRPKADEPAYEIAEIVEDFRLP
jgi:hypothetical protein